jgi:hypothetical protein
MQMPFPPPGTQELPPPGPIYQFFLCVVLVFLAFEMLLMILPEDLQRKVNQIRFGPNWPRH